MKEDVEAQRTFKENRGFLTEQSKKDKGAKVTRLVKYFNPIGGTWTVSEKRIRERKGKMDALDGTTSLLDSKSATGVATLTHTSRMKKISSVNNSFNTTSSLYGSRSSLEQFGIGHYGRKATAKFLGP